MNIIYKYPLCEENAVNTFEIPIVRPLRVDYQNGHPFMWAVIDPERDARSVVISRVATGQQLDADTWLSRYINTTVAQSEPYVWHWFWREEWRG